MSRRITCIRKSGGYHENPHEAISSMKWKDEDVDTTGESTRDEMWTWITNGNSAYVKDAYGNKVSVRAKTKSNGTHYVQTEADGKPTDNLLNLPEC
jgi:hypothetical protein